MILTFVGKRESYGMGEGEEDFATTVWCGVRNNYGKCIFRHAVFNLRREGYELAHEDAFKVSYYPFYAMHELRVG